VKSKNTIITEANEKAQQLASHFLNQFHDPNTKLTAYPPQQMRKPFTPLEVHTASLKLKNHKSSGPDDMYAEYIKHGPPSIYNHIASLFNNIAATGSFPPDILQGTLIPIPKPGKPSGPPDNFRPIILLNIIRKILATCILKRIMPNIQDLLPKTQSAYQSGRGTTEHITAIKLLSEHATSSNHNQIHLLLLDMSKAFDSIDRSMLLQDLESIAYPDEIHLIYILLNQIDLQVRCNRVLSSTFPSTKGVPQGDSLSPILFIIYLASSLSQGKPHLLEDHTYTTTYRHAIPPHLTDHTYNKPPHHININMQYADDIAFMTTNPTELEAMKTNLPPILKARNLNINNTKTEQYTISRKSSPQWKKCKYLGSLIDTTQEIHNRKCKTLIGMRKFKPIFTNNKLSTHTKIRIFNTYCKTIFLHNAETWTITPTLAKNINSFQRRLLRYAIGITYPQTISTIKLHQITKQEPWSKTISHRRLTWTGHLLRLHRDTPAKQALIQAIHEHPKPPGTPKPTWLTLVASDLAHSPIDILNPLTWCLAENKQAWKDTVRVAKRSLDRGYD
jgi:hypothetical protein